MSDEPPGEQSASDLQSASELRPATLLAFSEEGFSPPTAAEVEAALQRGKLATAQAAELLGVGAGTVEAWVAGEQEMPYAAWRLLLMHLGLIGAPVAQPEGLAGLLRDAKPRRRRTRTKVGGTSQSNFLKPRH